MNNILQSLDIENNCLGLFHQGSFVYEDINEIAGKYEFAWKHSPIFDDKEKKYIYLLLKNKKLSDYCGDSGLYSEYENRILAHQKAARTAGVSLGDNCFFDAVPETQLLKWFSLRQQAMERILSSSSDHSDYDILHKAHVLVQSISRQDVMFGEKTGRVLYDIFGSATGRLTTKKGSIPVLTLKKEQRSLIKPQNDALVELDLNAAEIRMLLALSGQSQPEEDIHEWICSEVYSNTLQRDEVKTKTFAWLYNFSAPKSRLDEIFSRQIFRDFYLPETQQLTTPFGRKLIVEERKAQNYLLQSTTSDQVLENAYKIHKMLKGKKSQIAFTLHDSIILDMSQKDAIMLKEIKNQFETTRWGKFKSTCKIGKTFGSLKELKL